MTNFILKNTNSRKEYKRRWKALERAKRHGVNVELAGRFYALMLRKGYEIDTVSAAMYYAAQNGVFGFVNSWER